MRIVLFAHPSFLGHKSMPRFTNMLTDGMIARGHQVEVFSPKAFFFNIPAPGFMKKWLGYIDQLLIFPSSTKKAIKKYQDTLFVFTDHALSMWMPVVKHLPNVIICHDFLAQRSALGEIPQNKTGYTGGLYQKMIRNGYSLGENFISVSKHTQQDLHRFLARKPKLSKVVYNGLNNAFEAMDMNKAREIISSKTGFETSKGYILHVGGNYWYKNRPGVVEIYNAWRSTYADNIPLFFLGAGADDELKNEIDNSPYRNDIYFVIDIDDQYMNAAYSGAVAMLFPSYAEGFGWPIAEAMASGCIAITTNDSPMTEVGADAAKYIPIRPSNESLVTDWAKESAAVLNEVINFDEHERLAILDKGLVNAKRFDTEDALNKIESIFIDVLKTANR